MACEIVILRSASSNHAVRLLSKKQRSFKTLQIQQVQKRQNILLFSQGLFLCIWYYEYRVEKTDLVQLQASETIFQLVAPLRQRQNFFL